MDRDYLEKRLAKIWREVILLMMKRFVTYDEKKKNELNDKINKLREEANRIMETLDMAEVSLPSVKTEPKYIRRRWLFLAYVVCCILVFTMHPIFAIPAFIFLAYEIKSMYKKLPF